MQTLYQIALVGHIVGLAALAGSTLVDYVLTKQFWKQYAHDISKAIGIHEGVLKLPMLFGIGIILLILSGITMMGITKGVFGEQIWFRIKFGLILLIILNGLAIRRRQGSKLRRLLSEENENRKDEFMKVKYTINWFHISQLAFFILIFVLSVFKFN